MEHIDIFRYLVGGYYGVGLCDEYELKVYVQKDIENYIKDYVNYNDLSNYDLYLESQDALDNTDDLTKLQDALLVLHKINGSLELSMLINNKINEIRENNFDY